jgi:long-chain fatty acid transport protein
VTKLCGSAALRLSFLLLAFAPRDAHAAGLYFSDRGVRPMGRGGAFVAGADDLGAIWYNPAGLADAGTSFLFDASWLKFDISYTRDLIVAVQDGNTTALQKVPSSTVNGTSSFLPLPTIAGSYNFGEHKEWTVAGGLIAPYVALASYPDTVPPCTNAGCTPSPARYTLSSFNGSLLAIPGVWAAYKPIEELRFGAGVFALTGIFQSTVTFSASPQDRLIGAPEQPEFDAQGQFRVGPIFAPSANAGVTWVPAKIIRVGLSGQLPMIIDAPATIDVTMPTASVFDNAYQDGNNATVRFELPAIVRAGVEVRPNDELRIEASYEREFWTTQHSIDVYPHNMSIDNVTGLPPKVAIPDISIPRNFDNSNSYRLGGEYHFSIGDYPLDIRSGIMYEQSAVPADYLSLSSLDFDKVILSLGGSIYIGPHWRMDAVYAHLFVSSVYVDPQELLATGQGIGRINPIKGNAPFEPVNGGQYDASADLFGVGVNYRF